MSSADGHVHTIPKSNSYLTLTGQFVTDGQCTFHKVLLVSLGTVSTAVTVFFPPLLKLQYHPIIDDFYISLNNVSAWRVVSYLAHETWWIVALKLCSLCIPWLATTTISSSAQLSLHCIHHLDCYTVTSNKHKQPGHQDKACNKL